MKQYFYVLFNPKRSTFYQDSQFGETEKILMAEQYDSLEAAENERSYFRKKDKWTVKKVTVSMD